jgi:hypothetical protein
MKKSFYKNILLLMVFIFGTLGYSFAQCNIPTFISNGQSNFGETMMGQTFKPTCTGSLSAFSFVGRAGANNQTATVNIRSSNGGTACNGTILATKAITMVGQASPGLINSVTFTTPIPVTANTVYFIEIVSAGAYAIDISSGSDRYTGGRNYYTKTGTTCGLSTINIDMVFTATIGAPLPIELTSFEGKNNDNQNFLTWTTASETQNKGFDIERSTDGSRFEKIGFVAGNGTTSQTQRYAFNDDKSPNGIAYYRLKQLDFDGRFEYSKIVAIAQKGGNAVSVFPNPSNGVFTLSGLENIEDEQISIVNSIGQSIAITIQNDGQMDLSAYPSGVYYLRIASSGQVVKLIHQ